MYEVGRQALARVGGCRLTRGAGLVTADGWRGRGGTGSGMGRLAVGRGGAAVEGRWPACEGSVWRLAAG